MLAKYLLLGLINPITIIWTIASTMQILNLSTRTDIWYGFALAMTNIALVILSCFFTFLLIKNIIEKKGIKL